MNANFNVQVINVNEASVAEKLSSSLIKGASVQVTYFKEVAMNKGTKLNRNRYIGRAFERVTMGGWVVGTNYNRSCQNAADRSENGGEFTSTNNSWHVYYNDFFEVDKATRTKFYLQLQRSAQTGNSTTTVVLVDGRPATDEELAEINSWRKKSTKAMPSTQVAAGVDADRERLYRCITLANIESIKQGDFSYNLKKAEHAAETYAK